MARAKAEAPLSIEEVSADSISRGDVTGNYDDMLRYVHGFLDQAVHQLLDGFSINFGYFSIHPSISGTYDSVNELFDKEKHQFRLSFRTRDRLRKLIDETVAVAIQGIADVEGTEININTPGMLSVRVPDNLAPGPYTIEIVTQYSAGSAKLLKEARVISYPVQFRVKD
ncbi:hypothetical protein Barb6_02689 [Bacteroidales bacterium Barb6]|nr:hypothetical protein Barb6_02689 [Bacteroidales bacterium Barb6]